MSHIPNSAIPHAGGTTTMEREPQGDRTLSDRVGKLADRARAHPKAAAAAGAAVLAGAVAAAAIPLIRKRSSTPRQRTSARKN